MKIIKTEEEKNNKKAISKEIDKKISNRVFVNLLVAISVMIYFCSIGMVYKNVQLAQIVDIVKVATMVFLGITLILIEVAYKKESKRFLIHAMEALFLAIHSLTTMHVIKVYDFDFQKYILTSSYIFSVYYVLKTIIINTKARSDYLKGLSDINEIVQKEEPKKKEASKKEKNEEQQNKGDNLDNIKKEDNKKEKKDKSEETSKKEKEKKPDEEKKDIDKEIEDSKNKIKNIRARLDKIQAKKSNADEKVKEEENSEEIQEQSENKKTTENLDTANITEKQEETKPKRKRGRPKKEVKVND